MSLLKPRIWLRRVARKVSSLLQESLWILLRCPNDTGNAVGSCDGNLPLPVRLQNGGIVQMQIGGSAQTLMQNSGLAIVLPIKYGISLLDKNKISYEH